MVKLVEMIRIEGVSIKQLGENQTSIQSKYLLRMWGMKLLKSTVCIFLIYMEMSSVPKFLSLNFLQEKSAQYQ